MLSLANARNEEELRAWDQRNRRLLREPGHRRTVRLRRRAQDRRAGHLAHLSRRVCSPSAPRAATARSARTSPRTCGRSTRSRSGCTAPHRRPVVEVRGEVYLPLAAFARLNEARAAEGLPDLRQPAQRRRRLDPPARPRGGRVPPARRVVLRHRLQRRSRPGPPSRGPRVAARAGVPREPGHRASRHHRRGRRRPAGAGRNVAPSSTTTSTAPWSRWTRTRCRRPWAPSPTIPLGHRLQVRAHDGDDAAAQHRGQRGPYRGAHARSPCSSRSSSAASPWSGRRCTTRTTSAARTSARATTSSSSGPAT